MRKAFDNTKKWLAKADKFDTVMWRRDYPCKTKRNGVIEELRAGARALDEVEVEFKDSK